jgi:hypothetical protein
VQASAFIPRTRDAYLSVNWLENLACANRTAEVEKLRGIFSAKMDSIGARAEFAILKLGDAIDRVLKESSDQRKLRATHEPESNDQSHSGLHNLQSDDLEIAELLIQVIRERYPARTQ